VGFIIFSFDCPLPVIGSRRLLVVAFLFQLFNWFATGPGPSIKNSHLRGRAGGTQTEGHILLLEL
jgi:hypothetical protein